MQKVSAMRKISLLPLIGCLAALSLLAFARANASAPTVFAASEKPEIVGYVFPQNTRLAPDAIDARKLTRINYAFANILNGKMVEGFADDDANFATLTALRKRNPSLKILVSVGGWLWSGNFSDVALNANNRSVFIESVVTFLSRHNLDGLDVDWEYPGMQGSGHRYRQEDKQNYTLLLKELRKRLDTAGAVMHRHLYLTIAAGASGDFLAHTQMSAVQGYVDTVNLMAYDYYEPDSDRTTGNHAPLYTDPADPKRVSADASVRAFTNAGVPARKLLLGVPFYGHVWGQVPDRNHGLFAPGKQVANDSYAQYSRIAGGMVPPGFVRYRDAASSEPYLYSEKQRLFISYEDATSLKAKCEYVISHQLGGVMFWEYDSDPTGTLLDTLYRSLREDTAAH